MRRAHVLLFVAVAAVLALTVGGSVWMWQRLDTLEAQRAGPAPDMSAAWWAFALGSVVILAVIALFVRLSLASRNRD